MQVARHLGPGHTIVTVLCDRADRYAAKLYSREFLSSKGLPVPAWIAGQSPGPDVLQSALSRSLVDPNI